MTLIIATTNQHKLTEIRELLADVLVELKSLRDLPPVAEPEETGDTFEENAKLKALYYDACLAEAIAKGARRWAIVADDSGLVVDALDGEPGVRSARFLREDASYPERFAEIYRRLAERPDQPRTARFVCAVAVVSDGRVIYETTGTVEGEIADPPRGDYGFGYDPIFYYPPYGTTLAEVTSDRKNRVAHRGRAFRQVADWLRSQ